MSRPCPRCGEHDFVVQTEGVFAFDGEHITSVELRNDPEENEGMNTFSQAHVICNKCDWSGTVRELEDPGLTTILHYENYDELKQSELLLHIRSLENRLHAIYNAVDEVDGETPENKQEVLKLVSQAVRGIDWMIEPRCPECGWALDHYVSGDPTAAICHNCEWLGPSPDLEKIGG